MKKQIKKMIIKVLLLLAIALMVNAGRLLIMEHMDKDISFHEINKEANSYEACQGNYVLCIGLNGIKQAPFVFGERLMLYSAEEDKWYLLKNLKGVFDAMMDDLAILDTKVFYEEDDMKGGGTCEIQWMDLTEKQTGRVTKNEDFYGHYAITGETFFGIIADWDEPDIVKVNLGNHEQEVIIEGEPNAYEAVLHVKDNVLYTYNEEEDYLITKNLDTGEESKYTTYPACIEQVDEEHFIVLDACTGNITEYNEKTEGSRVIANVFSDPKAEMVECRTCSIRDNIIYCNNEESDIIQVNYKTGEKKTLIHLKDWMEKGFDSKLIDYLSVSYMTDYIAVDVRYTVPILERLEIEREKKKLLIFDYDGNYIRTKSLN